MKYVLIDSYSLWSWLLILCVKLAEGGVSIRTLLLSASLDLVLVLELDMNDRPIKPMKSVGTLVAFFQL